MGFARTDPGHLLGKTLSPLIGVRPRTTIRMERSGDTPFRLMTEPDLPTKGNVVSVGRFKGIVSIDLLSGEFRVRPEALCDWLRMRSVPITLMDGRAFVTLIQVEEALLKEFGLTADDLTRINDVYGLLLKRDIRIRLGLENKYKSSRQKKLRKMFLSRTEEAHPA